MKEIEPVASRFPRHELAIRRLYFSVHLRGRQRSLRALRYWQSAGTSSDLRIEQYRELVNELEGEISNILEGSYICLGLEDRGGRAVASCSLLRVSHRRGMEKMKMRRRKVRSVIARLAGVGTVFAAGLTAVALAAPAAAQEKKPNILFIMGDDIGWMQPSVYHRGLMGRRNAQHRSHRQRGRHVRRLRRHAERVVTRAISWLSRAERDAVVCEGRPLLHGNLREQMFASGDFKLEQSR